MVQVSCQIYRKMFLNIFLSYLVCSQIWLNLFVNHPLWVQHKMDKRNIVDPKNPHPWIWNWDCKRWEPTNSKWHGPIHICDQSRVGMRLCTGLLRASAYWAKMLSQSHFTQSLGGKFLLIFIQNMLCNVPVGDALSLGCFSTF